MGGVQIRNFVEKERSNLCDGRDSIADAVVFRPKCGTDVAIGLLALGKTEEAIEWFRAVTPEWEDSGTGAFTARYVEDDDKSAQGKQWRQYQRGLQTAILGQSENEEIAEMALENASREFIDDLESRELVPRIDLVRTLGGFLLTNECNVTALRDRVEETAGHHKEAFNRAYYLPQATAIEAIGERDAAAVAVAIEDLLEFHEEFVIGSPDANVVDEAVAFDACAYLALARQRGLDIAVDSEYVPDALTDDEYYSVDEV